MPLFDYVCSECKFAKQHYLTADKSPKKNCPKCGSEEYKKQLGKFGLNVEYSNVQDIMENKIDPSVEETYRKIGKETLDQDTKTLDNLFGEEKVERTYHGSDD